MGANTAGPRKLFYGVCVCVCVNVWGRGGMGGLGKSVSQYGWLKTKIKKKKLAKTP